MRPSAAVHLVLAAAILLLASSVSARAQSGALEWATRAGSNSVDEGWAVTTDAAGSVYATGYFKSTATFGPGEPNETMLTSIGQDVYIAKYASDGSLVWVREIDSAAGWGRAIDLDGAGNIYVFGYFDFSITFDPGGPNELTLNSFANDVFLAKFDADGDFVWAAQAGGSLSDYGYGLAVDEAGNSYVTGRYGSNPATFGAGEPNETVLAGLGGSNGVDVFVAKYDSDGLLEWAKSAGGTTGNYGAGIGIDAAANSYVVGRFSGTATFGPGEANETTLIGPLGGNDEIFIAKYAPDGSLVWVRDGQGQAENDRGEAIAVDAAGNSYATGTYRGLAPFGGQLNPTQAALADLDDIFVVKHDADGVLLWVKYAVGVGSDFALGIALDEADNVYLTGYGAGITFGAEEPGETAVGGVGAQDVFVAKLDGDGLTQWATLAGGSSDDRGHGIAAGASGRVHVTGRFGQMATFGAGEANETTLASRGSFDIFVAEFQASAICGDANGDGAITPSDALIALRAAVNIVACALCLCDVDSSMTVAPSDALQILRRAVGQAVELNCVPC